MAGLKRTREDLKRELGELRRQLHERDLQLAEAQETLRAIHEGDADAQVDSTPKGQQIFVLQSADETYRSLVEQVQEGAVTLVDDGRISYSNRRFAELIKRPLEQVIGARFAEFVAGEDQDQFYRLSARTFERNARGELTLRSGDGVEVPVQLDISEVVLDGIALTCVVVTDLTERKRIDQIRANGQFIRQLIDHTPIGIAVVGRDFHYVLANPAYQSLAETPVVGRSIADVFAPEVAKMLQRVVQQALDTGQAAEFREYETRIHGRTWWNVSQIPLRDSAGDVEAVLILTQDVTEQCQAKNAMRQSEQQFRAMFELASVGIVQVDVANGKLLRCNERYCQITGYSRQELAGLAFSDLTHPEERARDWQIFSEAARGKTRYLNEKRYVRKDGSVIWVRLNAAFIGSARNQSVLSVAICEDITERRCAEEALRESQDRFRSVLENSLDAAYRRDLRTDTYDYLSPVIERVLGIRPDQLQPMSQDAMMERIHPEDRDGVLVAIREGTRLGEGRVEYRFRTGESQYAWLADHFRVQTDAAGVPVFLGGIIRDVTQQKRVEQELRAARAEAEAANNAKSQFLANMSHELRTPMNAILGMTDLALREELPPALADYLQTVKDSGEVLLELLNQLLDFSRIEAGQMELDHHPFQLRDTVTHVVKTLGVRAAEKYLELICDVTEDVPDGVVGDPLRLRQVLINLVGNAIKFTDEGEIVIAASVQSRGEDDVVLRFAVRDTGAGIAPEDQERIFSPFAQADASTTRRHGGSGLGLAIVKNLVGLMEGEVRLQSELDRGSTFSFTVRLGLQSEPDVRHSADPLEQESIRGLSLLVVAENATSRRMLDRTLSAWGMSPEVVTNVPAALAKVHQAAAAGRRFQLVLADASLPQIDGFSLAEWLGKDVSLAGPVILMISAAERSSQVERCRAVGAAYLEKPISPSRLLDTIVCSLGVEHAPRDRRVHSGSGPLPRPLRILLAEDTPANQKLATYLLTGRGHTVQVVGDGQQALSRLQQEEFDVVLMDVQMPVMDGFKATAAIRDLPEPAKARIPIIAMTAHALRGDAERCLSAGMDGYISKPIDAEELIGLVERMPDAARAREHAAIRQLDDPDPNARSATPLDDATREPRTDALVMQAPFDPEEGIRKCYGSPDMFNQMVACFSDEAYPILAKIRDALARQDAEAVHQAAHRLKNTVVYLAAAPARAATEQLDALGRSGDLSQAPAAVDKLAVEVERLRAAIHAYREQHPSC